MVLPEHVRLLERALKEGGNQNYRLAFFDKLGHFFGQIVQDGIHRTHLATDERVMETIVQWLKENLTPPQKEEIPTQPEEETQEPAEDRESPETDSI